MLDRGATPTGLGDAKCVCTGESKWPDVHGIPLLMRQPRLVYPQQLFQTLQQLLQTANLLIPHGMTFGNNRQLWYELRDMCKQLTSAS